MIFASGRGVGSADGEEMVGLVMRREGRLCVRAVTRPRSPYPSKRNRKDPLAQHAECTLTIRPPHQAPPAHADQPKHPGNPENKPP